MEFTLKSVSNYFRNFVWYTDYYLDFLYDLPFKFKKLPEIKKILIIELKYIGDIIVTTPTIRALKQKLPNATIDIMVPKGMEDILYNNPNINKIIQEEKFIKNFFKYLREIKKEKYDLAVILHNGTISVSTLLFLAGIKYRIGCTKVGVIECKGLFLHKKTKPTFELKHKVEDNLDVIRTINADTNDKHLELYTNKETDKEIENLLAKHNIKDFILIHAAPQHETHKWFNDRFAKLADELVKKYKTKIIFSGAEKDIELNNEIISLMKEKAVNFAGTTIKQFVSLVNKASLVISVDTGAMHVAAALEKPIIALFGAGVPKIWHPYTKIYKVLYKDNLCTGCLRHHCNNKNYLECMKSIQIEDVLKAVEELK